MKVKIIGCGYGWMYSKTFKVLKVYKGWFKIDDGSGHTVHVLKCDCKIA